MSLFRTVKNQLMPVILMQRQHCLFWWRLQSEHSRTCYFWPDQYLPMCLASHLQETPTFHYWDAWQAHAKMIKEGIIIMSFMGYCFYSFVADVHCQYGSMLSEFIFERNRKVYFEAYFLPKIQSISELSFSQNPEFFGFLSSFCQQDTRLKRDKWGKGKLAHRTLFVGTCQS